MSEASQTPQHPTDMSRRNFMTLLTGLFAAMWGVMATYPLYRYLQPPATGGPESNVSSVVVGAADAIPVGGGQNFQFGNIPAIVTHTAPNEFHAFNAVCTHLGCTVPFRDDMNRIWCACHGGQYDPVTGDVVAGPPPKPLAPLRAEVRDGQLVVSRS